jgi:hypothetical protein
VQGSEEHGQIKRYSTRRHTEEVGVAAVTLCASRRGEGVRSPCLGLDSGYACGGRLECLHRSPANRKRRRKENPVPGGITASPSL